MHPLVSKLMSLPTRVAGQGLDISKAMLDVAAEREVEGDLCLHDLVGWRWSGSTGQRSMWRQRVLGAGSGTT